jgi:hypothetical protein
MEFLAAWSFEHREIDAPMRPSVHLLSFETAKVLGSEVLPQQGLQELFLPITARARSAVR